MKTRKRGRTVAAQVAAIAVPLCLATLHAASPPPARSQGTFPFTIVDVGFRGFDINGSGIEVFPSIDEDGVVAAGHLFDVETFHAARTTAAGTQQIDLGALPQEGVGFSNAFRIRGGTAVGISSGRSGETAVLFRDGEVIQLPDLSGNSISVALGLNAQGDVVGQSDLRGGGGSARRLGHFFFGHAFIVQNGEAIDLGTLPGFTASVAYAVNNNRRAVGESFGVPLERAGKADGRATMWENGQPVDLGTLLGDATSAAFDVNEAGVLVGGSRDAAGRSRAFRRTGNSLETIPGLEDVASVALGLNDAGQIVGCAATLQGPVSRTQHRKYRFRLRGAVDGPSTAFQFTPGQGSVDLQDLIDPALGWDLEAATSINARGQIAGVGFLNGVPAVFRMSPASQDTTPPVISACNVQPRRLPASGGQVTITATVTDAGGTVARVTATIGTSPNPARVNLDRVTGDSFRAQFTFPANEGSEGLDFPITLEAEDNSGNISEPDDCGVVTVEAPGVVGRLAVAPSPLRFPATPIGTSARRRLLLRNDGDAPLTVRVRRLSGPFQVAGTTINLAPGARRSLNARFRPRSVGTQQRTLSLITSNPAQGLVRVQLIGEGCRRNPFK